MATRKSTRRRPTRLTGAQYALRAIQNVPNTTRENFELEQYLELFVDVCADRVENLRHRYYEFMQLDYGAAAGDAAQMLAHLARSSSALMGPKLRGAILEQIARKILERPHPLTMRTGHLNLSWRALRSSLRSALEDSCNLYDDDPSTSDVLAAVNSVLESLCRLTNRDNWAPRR